ncbi:MAG: crossover junction endodeoxyribonuclease RuvC [Gammaproteobacteria bacterium]|nr:crossover junction endodeoxyribonuclease RuvC [Gammaproteobacteria bacterium]
MIILGIDPGSRTTGYGIIKNHPDKMEYVDSGFIRVKGDSFPQRLGYIFQQLTELIQRHQPAQMSIENVFMHKNADSALKLGQARGAAICAGYHCGLEVSEYAAREVKLAIVGKGAAQKEQVKHMVQRLLSLKQDLQVDESDALAIAMCHAQHQTMEKRTGIPAKAFNRKRSYRR